MGEVVVDINKERCGRNSCFTVEEALTPIIFSIIA